MLFYAAVITNRIKYVTVFIEKEILGELMELTSDREKFSKAEEPKINYSGERISENEIWIDPHSLLFEETIHKIEVKCFVHDGLKAFFKTAGDYPFDIFAATFYLLSRYEEYLPYEEDSYGRFPYDKSIAFQHDFLKLPLINLCLKDFRKFLKKKFPLVELTSQRFVFIPTYDIDEAYSYKHKGFLRNVGATAKSIFRGDFRKVGKRVDVLTGKQNDPFDSYEWMDHIHKEYNLEPRYFFLVPDRLSKYDRNILPQKQAVKDLIVSHSKKYSIGVHPSWQSNYDSNLISKEIKTIRNITNKPVVISRQHFIRFTLPKTYRQLISAGIKEEFSMGYGSINGFRASVASPFHWFDLEKNEQTSLLVYPFCFMDANSFFEQKLNPTEAYEEMKYYFNTIKESGGCMVTIWHNTFLGTDDLFSGWRQVYHDFISYAKPGQE